jgi:serine/threonine protein kinase
MQPSPQGSQPDPTAPFRISRYELHERIGEGATAVVYAARDRDLQREVAIKVLRESIGMSEIARERFRREAQAAAGLSHPNLVTVYDAGTAEGQAYLVMERVQGRSLGDVLRNDRPGERELVKILERAARGVAAAHEKGIVHRDLKPANILMNTAGDPKVGDFGMAHLMDSRLELTETGVAVGTPLYMAPEQVEGRTQDITPRTDVYGLGAILYEMLAGRPPHLGDSILELYSRIARQETASPRSLNPKVPPELEAVALKALEKEPSRRYATAALFADELARYLEGKPVLARRTSPAYRLYRRLKRHRGVVVAGAATLLLLGGLTVERLRAREASQSSLETARTREESLRRLSHLWGRTVAVYEWRQQLSRKPADIRKELEGLLQEVSRFISDYRDLPQGYYVRARAAFTLGDFPSAEADLTHALDRHPDFSPGWSLLAQVRMEKYVSRLYAWTPRLRAARKIESQPILREAEAALARCTGSGKAESEKWGLSWSREDNVNETLIGALKECHIDGNREAAKARLEKAHAESAAAEYCDMIGNWSGDAKLALPWMDRAISLAPNWARPYLDRGVVRGVLGERELAVEDFTRAIEIHPNLPIAYDNRAVMRTKLKDFDGAILDCDRALKLDPGMDSALVHRAEARQAMEDHQGAIEDVSKALTLSPAFSTAWSVRAKSWLSLGNLDRAGSDIARAIELEPEEPWHYLLRAMLAQLRRDAAGVVEDCNRVLQLAPPNWEGRAAAEQLKAAAKRP